jgi:hypothetical protein
MILTIDSNDGEVLGPIMAVLGQSRWASIALVPIPVSGGYNGGTWAVALGFDRAWCGPSIQ